MEILAPAGNRAALERADAAGADAVYLGYSAFSARAGAGNFGREELAEAIRYAHARHMRVYVTVNTLVKDAELAGVAEVLELLRKLRADGVLVQDLGVLRMTRALAPGLSLHASTQMTIHNRQGVRWCAEAGMTRAVLARECSLEEIRQCCSAGTEIEVFGHGALCVCVSGQCLFSSMVGERSGNRGRCAQPCRQVYRYRGQEGAWLSPRDLCLRDELPALAGAGVASVKLEGRLKRPEYVAVTAASYRRAADRLAEGNFRPADAAEKDGLAQMFNRGGFMTGYAFGCEDAGVIYPDSVSHQGVRVGRVEGAERGLARIRLQRAVGNGDGLVIRRGREPESLTYSGPDRAAGELLRLRLREGIRAEKGDPVDRLTDKAQMDAAAAMPGRKVPADLYLRAAAGERAEVTAGDGEITVTVSGEMAAPARTRPASPEELEKQLAKTGGTLFIPRHVRAEAEGVFLPVSEVNRLRREALEKLEEARADAFAPNTGAAGAMPEIRWPAREIPPAAIVRTREQADAARGQGFRVIRYPEDWREDALRALLAEMPAGDWLRLPEVCEGDTLERIRQITEEYRDRIGGILLGTVGQLGVRWPVPVAAGSGVPVMNRQAAAALLEAGCEFVTASPELTGKELETLLAGNLPIAVPVYGRTQLMLMHHCPARTALGKTKGHRDCALCDIGAPEALRGSELEDRRGYRYPLLRLRLPEGCLVRLMNALPTDNADRQDGAAAIFELTDETPEEAERIAAAVKDGRTTGRPATRGHRTRPVE